MFATYVFCLILSGVFLGISVFSDFMHADVPDAGMDIDAHIGTDSGHAGESARLLSIRGLLYFLFGFGALGTALSLFWTGGHPVWTGALAGLGGIGSGAVATALFAYLKRSESGDVPNEDVFVGLLGRIVVPISAQGVGQVRVERQSGTVDLVAVPFGDPEGDVSTWREVVVIEMKGGRALVAPAEEKLLPG